MKKETIYITDNGELKDLFEEDELKMILGTVVDRMISQKGEKHDGGKNKEG